MPLRPQCIAIHSSSCKLKLTCEALNTCSLHAPSHSMQLHWRMAWFWVTVLCSAKSSICQQHISCML